MGPVVRRRGQDEVSGAMDWLVGSSQYQLQHNLETEWGGCGKCSGLGGLKDKNRDE